MSRDTLCILNQFARSVISIIAGVWHGGQTLSALCRALLKVLAHRKITLECKYWHKCLYVLRTIALHEQCHQGGKWLQRRSDLFPFFFPHRGCVALRTSPRCGPWISSDVFPAFSPSSPSSKCSCLFPSTFKAVRALTYICCWSLSVSVSSSMWLFT